jgi:hypothetical protein
VEADSTIQMICIAIITEAFDTIARTLALGTVACELQLTRTASA